MTKKTWGWALIAGLPLAFAAPAHAAGEASGFSPGKSLGLYAYPKKNQNADQQLKDENKCYASAKEQTGVDPQDPSTTSVPVQATPEQRGGAVRGAARGAAAGAAVGAIAGDPGTGAAVGAAAGGARGRRAQNQSQAQQQQQAQAQAQQAADQKLDGFKRSFSACMEARGYSVK